MATDETDGLKTVGPVDLSWVPDDELLKALAERCDIFVFAYFKKGGGKYNPALKKKDDDLGAMATIDVLKTGWLVGALRGVFLPSAFAKFREEFGPSDKTDPTPEDVEKFKKWLGIPDDPPASEESPVAG